MKRYIFNYTNKFNCIGNKCKHNCCVGWNISIDKKTLSKYTALKTTDEKFNDNCFLNNSFRLNDKNRCPFLEDDNLCYVIKNYGESALCNTCKTHPRFKNFFSGRTETGLGLYCEEACKIILSQKSKMRLQLVKSTKKNIPLTPFERKIIKFRKQVLDIVQNRTIKTIEKIAQLEKLSTINLNDNSYSRWVEIYNNLEKLSINEFTFNKLTALNNFCLPIENFERVYEQLIAYLTFRHISRAMDNLDLKVRLSFIVLSFKIINQIFNLFPDKSIENFIESCRLYCCEIEVNDFNITTLLNEIEKLVKFI